MNTATVLSLGAGVQSTAMLLMAESGEIERPDFAIFADTQSEPKSVYDWLHYIETLTTIPIIRVTKGNLMTDALGSDRVASMPLFVRNPDGSQGLARRQCTAEYKLAPIFRGIRDRLAYQPKQRVKHEVRMLVGISCDEVYRMKSSRIGWITNVYPLIDLWYSRQKCIEIVQAKTGRTPPRSACIVCPYHNDHEWSRMQDQEPEHFAEAVAFDLAIRNQEKFEGQNFLHRSMKPLGEVEFSNGKNQPDLFNNECEGMCGV